MDRFCLPENHKSYTDKYFLRSNEILKAEGLNPFVRAQVFIRKGPGVVYGINEALAILEKYSKFREHGGRVFALQEGSAYESCETLLLIEAPVQDIIELETMYLGVITAQTTLNNGGWDIKLDQIEANMKAVVDAAEGRPVSYFGARHWHWNRDKEIAEAALKGGATDTSTDIGSSNLGKQGIGTIPHILENVYAWKLGPENAVLNSTLAFDRHMPVDIPRIALIDYHNKEVGDTLSVANNFGKKGSYYAKTRVPLFGVRVDTCGENYMEKTDSSVLRYFKHSHINDKFWFSNGVSIAGVYEMRKILNLQGHQNIHIILTSGFGEVDKVKAFVEAEKELKIKLFDGLGVGGIFSARMATMDIVAVGNTIETMVPMSKIGRKFRENSRLEKKERR